MDFVLSNADKYHAIVGEQVAGEQQAAVNHGTPVGMETAVAVGILHHAISFVVHGAAFFGVLGAVHAEVVFVDKVVAGVVGRVDVYHLDLAQVALLQEFQGFEVVAFDVEVLGGVEVLGFFHAGAQRLADGFRGFYHGVALADPGKFVGLVAFRDALAEHLLERIEIHRLLQLAILGLAFGHAIREQRGNLLDIHLRHIGSFKLHLFHGEGPILSKRY